jgi:hypothetical protein
LAKAVYTKIRASPNGGIDEWEYDGLRAPVDTSFMLYGMRYLQVWSMPRQVLDRRRVM